MAQPLPPIIDYQLILKSFESGLDWGARLAMSALWMAIKEAWVQWWPYILAFLLFVTIGVIIQIVMMRVDGHRNRLSPGFNSMVGSLVRLFFVLLLLLGSYKIFGTKVVDETWFWIFGLLAYQATRIFLRKIGFWYY